jgi:hypothetical protein
MSERTQRLRTSLAFQAWRTGAALASAALALRAAAEPLPPVGVAVSAGGCRLQPAHGSAAGVWFYAEREAGSQLLLTGHETVPGGWKLAADLTPGATLRVEFDRALFDLNARTNARSEGLVCRALTNGIALSGRGSIRLSHLCAGSEPLAFRPARRPFSREPVAVSPELRPAVAATLIEWDWRMQDGVGAPREPRTYAQAAERLLERMAAASLGPAERAKLVAAKPAADADDTAWETFWLAAHRLRRTLLLDDPALTGAPLLFVKHVPSVMSHQLTQLYGYCARPGGGLFQLDAPGDAMRARNITPSSLPAGSFMTPELSFDAQRLLFAYCPVKEAPAAWDCSGEARGLRYRLYELTLSTGSTRALTPSDADAFFPVCLPSGDILFSSTMRGGFHRCGRGPCPVYTLSSMGPNGESPRSISFHETHEWDPCLLGDGRVIYTRWDYVDRNAVHYQQLWSARPDGGNVRIYYGNNTWNPPGTWEARAVPGSHRVMATASPHHGMSAGSVVLLDVTKGVDGKEPLTRLTPEARFPESEAPLARGPDPARPYDFDTAPSGYWNSPLKEPWMERAPTEEERRWPGHCYKSPWPLSEARFIASYSYDRLVGEPGPNIPNMFGIYLCDAFGNKELLYRDPAISCLWARPLAPRAPPPEVASSIDPARREKSAGTFFLSNVMESWPYLPTNRPVTHLRLFQVLLKTTPHIDQPKVAAGLGAPGRQVLGTVPVEPDGSAYFEAPAKTPLYFQALDAQGRAVQTMRSLVYLQPGETETCIGCHEPRMKKEPPRAQAQAIRRAPSAIAAGPDGSKPFSYPRLVQPVLDKHCVTCHDGKEPKRPVLTGAPEGWASKSFNALIKHVACSAWGNANSNYEPLSEPLRFGALGSPLAAMLEKGHGKVALTPDDWARLYLWMDANGAFYGTFDAAEQKRQLAGAQIAGPAE